MLYSYIYIDIFLSLSALFLCQTKGEEAGAAGTNQEHLSHLLALPDIVVMLFF